ncbi:MAG: DUF5050 domain-containing protein [Ignavibacteria bacterium]|nr:DUF5050 domain-containing protein [Ignavibacteria bacterium]
MIGQTISHYTILEKLGEGGMGVVYKAHDTKLDRFVALKFLPHGILVSEEDKARFLQEARAASAVMHPNVCVIYDIAEHEGQQFIVMEFVDGKTLRHIIPVQKIQDAITYAIQIGDALHEAHSKGVVHRDIKTDNIMVNTKNQVKVMDFGLAKLKGSLKLTKTSSTVGTLAYMAPEQIQGAEVDARSDIFSFGVVLFEMLTGRLPFRGEHEAAMMYSILNEEPAPLQKYLPDVSPELVHIVITALEKDPNDRYQSAADMVRDLRRVQKKTSRVVRPQPTEAMKAGIETPPIPAEPSVVAPKRRLPRVVWVAVATVALIIIAVSLYLLFRPLEMTTPSPAMKLSRLTATGNVNNVVISPDQRFIVYSQREKGKQSLWMRQIATASTIQILPPAEVFYQGLTLSKDGNYLYYVVYQVGSPRSSLYKVPLLGGTSRKLLDDVQSAISLSPDEKQFAFRRYYPKSGEFALMVANEDGSADRILATHKADKWFYGKPSWSPDGETIVCALGDHTGGFHYTPMAVRVKDGSEKRVTSQRWQDMIGVDWLDDGSGLVVCGLEKGSTDNQLWLVQATDGSVRRITNDLTSYSSLSLAQGSRTLSAIQSQSRSSLWIVPRADATKAVQITTGKEEGFQSITFTPDGRILYTNYSGGNGDICICDADGSNQKQLTTEPSNEFQPAVSPDCRTVYFVSDRSGVPNIWRMQIDGSKPQQLTFGGEDYFPEASVDGKWLYFSSWDTGPFLAMKLPVEGGEPTTVFAKGASYGPTPSPDGKLLAFLFADDQRLGKPQILIIPSAGGDVVNTLEFPITAQDFSTFQWTPDGRGISYVDDREGISNIWEIPLSGGEPRKLTDFKSDYIFSHAWSPDGKQLAVARGQRTSDAVLMSNFR